MNLFNGDADLALIVVCSTILIGLKILIEFIKFLFKRNEPKEPEVTSVDEILTKETYFIAGDDEPYFKLIIKRTWSNGEVEIITTND